MSREQALKFAKSEPRGYHYIIGYRVGDPDRYSAGVDYLTTASPAEVDAITCNNPPSVPTLVAPPNGFATLTNWVNSNPTFSATVSDPGDTVRAYFNFLQVAGNPIPPVDQNGTTVSSGLNSTWTPFPALVDGKYDWRAKAIDSQNAQSGYTGYWRVKKDTVLPTTGCGAPTRSGNTVSIAILSGSDPLPASNGTPSGIKSGNLERSTNGGSWVSVATYTGTAAVSGTEYTTSISNSYSAVGTPGDMYAYRYSVMDGANNSSTVISCGSVAIPIPNDYTLSNSGNITVTQGKGGSNTVSATLASGSGFSVNFSASGLPLNATSSFSPTSCTPTCSTAFTINTAPTTPTGIFPITVTGTSAGLPNKTTSFNLNVNVGVPTVDLRANGLQNLTGAAAITPADTLTLNWTTTNTPTSCSASGIWSGAKNASGGSETVSNPGVGTFTYTITCSKTGFPNAVDSTAVEVRPPAVSTISCTVNPVPSFIGEAVTWNISLNSGQGSPPFDYILDWFWATDATCGTIDMTKTDIAGTSFSSSAPFAPAICSSAWNCSTPDLSPYTQEGFVCLNATVRDPDAGTEADCLNVVLEVKDIPDWKEIPPE